MIEILMQGMAASHSKAKNDAPAKSASKGDQSFESIMKLRTEKDSVQSKDASPARPDGKKQADKTPENAHGGDEVKGQEGQAPQGESVPNETAVETLAAGVILPAIPVLATTVNQEGSAVPPGSLETAQPVKNTAMPLTEKAQGQLAEAGKVQIQTKADTQAQSTGPVDHGKEQGAVKREGAAPAQTATNQAQEQSGARQSSQVQKSSAKEEGTANQTELPNLVKTQQSDLDKVFVKVGESAKAAESPSLPANVAEKIVVKTAEGKQEFDIQLTPRELGKISIKMIFEGGKALILMHCSNPQTQQLLSANAEQIRSIVESGTGMHTEVSVKEDAFQNMADQTPDQRGENQARDEQEDRLTEKRAGEADTSAFLQRFRLGLAETGVSEIAS